MIIWGSMSSISGFAGAISPQNQNTELNVCILISAFFFNIYYFVNGLRKNCGGDQDHHKDKFSVTGSRLIILPQYNRCSIEDELSYI